MIVFAAIQGGWEYVIPAYVITWALLVGYTISLWWRSGDRGEDG